MDPIDSQQKRNIVIVGELTASHQIGRRRLTLLQGGGIIGCTTAYFLTRHPAFNPALHKVTVLEAASIAAGASGRAGGLLALWAYPSCLVPLSYRLHTELAAEHNGAERWGYRKVGCGSISAVVKAEDLKNRPPRAGGSVSGTDASGTNGNGEQKKEEGTARPAVNGGGHDALPVQSADDKEWEKLPKQDSRAASLLADSSLPADLDWIDRALVRDYSEMGLGRTSNPETAQVHPYHFTTAMAQLARERGVEFLLGARVTRINHSKAAVASVEYEYRGAGGQHKTLDGVTDVVVTAGPWTGTLLPKTKVDGLRAHSVVYDADVSPYAVFTDIALPADWVPEHRAAQGQRRKHKGNVDPEIYARPFGEVYACGRFPFSLYLFLLPVSYLVRYSDPTITQANPTPRSRCPKRPTRCRRTRRNATTWRRTLPPCRPCSPRRP